MLPTQGLFKSIACPYYVAGLCERPNCLFRHTKQDVEATKLLEDKCSDDLKNSSKVKPRRSSSTTNIKNEKDSKDLKDKTHTKVEGGHRRISKSTDVKSHRRERKHSERKSSLKDIPESANNHDDDQQSAEKEKRIEHPFPSEKLLRRSRSPVKHTSPKQTSTELTPQSTENLKQPHENLIPKSPEKPLKDKDPCESFVVKQPPCVDLVPQPPGKTVEKSSDKKKSSHSRHSHSHKKRHLKSKDSREKTIQRPPEKLVVQPSEKLVEEKNGYDIMEPDEFSFPEGNDYDDDPDDIAMQCLQMFEDYKPEIVTIGDSPPLPNQGKSNIADADNASGRRRQAHPGARGQLLSSRAPPANRPSSHKNLHAAVASRIESQSRIKTAEAEVEVKVAKPSASTKKRIAHVPNVAGLLRAPSHPGHSKATGNSGQLSTTTLQSNSNGTQPATTIPKTSTKGAPRVAHRPSTQKVAKRPLIGLDSPTPHGKMANYIRQSVLDQLYDESLLVFDSPEIAFRNAVEEEAQIAKRAVTKPVYLSLGVSKIRALRRQLALKDNFDETVEPNSGNLVSHQATLATCGDNNFSIIPSRRSGLPQGKALYNALKRYVMSEEDLVKHSYPRPHPSGEPGRVVARPSHWDKPYISEHFRRTCERCAKVFDVSEDGTQTTENSCTFHPGRKEKRHKNKEGVWIYYCCGGETSGEGCTTVNYHVPKSHPVSQLRGFVCSVQDMGDESLMGTDLWDIIALDCEMVYTTNGNQLARVTVIGIDKNILYDQLVVPASPILDYNTPFSGLTEKMMAGASMRITDIQAALLTRIKPNTIIIGHSLESDLVALRFRHDCVIDTGDLYPHRQGFPFKRALRHITADVLKELIQNSEAGHDSAEDARAALNLVLHKLQEDLKLEGRST